MSAERGADDLDQFVEEQVFQEALDERLRRERENTQRKFELAELRRLTNLANQIQAIKDCIATYAPAIEVPPYQPPKPKLDRAAPEHVWMLLLSDWQLGQRTTLGSSGLLFEQTSEVCKQQVRAVWEKLEALHTISQHSVRVDTLAIMALGDLIDNDQMRPSQATGVDALVTVQFLGALDLFIWIVRQALRRFRQVIIEGVGGNHGRTSPKAGNAGLGELGYIDNYEWLLIATLERIFEKEIASGRLVIRNHDSFFGTTKIANLRIVFEHGASFRAGTGSYGGVAYYAIQNAAKGYAEMLGGADLVLMGHFHRPLILPMANGWGWQILNGALPPSSEFAQSNFKAFGRPSQTLLELHPDHGLIGWKLLYCEHPSQMRPGTYWDTVDEQTA